MNKKQKTKSKERTLLIISGPTATGKTSLAFRLAGKFNGELISADSRQVYKGMDIVTGKDWGTKNKEQKTKNKIHIWGYDAVEPNGEWSASHFVKFAKEVIADIQKRGKLPIVVGGTGLYIANLLNPPETLNIPPDKKLRFELEKLSVVGLQDRLRKINPERLASMNESDQRNPRRLVRAIEIAILALKGWTFFKGPGLFRRDALHIDLTAMIEIVDKRIEERVKQRIKQGAEQEVRKLVKKYGWDSALKFTIGYKEWKPYIGVDRKGTGNREQVTGNREQGAEKKEIVRLWAMHEKQYARRQLTWMAKYSADKLFNISQQDYIPDIEAYVSRWYYGKR